MFTIFLVELKKHRNLVIALLAVHLVFFWMFVAMYPEISEQGEVFAELVSNYPESFIQAMGIDTQTMFQSLEGFISGEYYSIMWQIFLTILGVSMGGRMIAGEVDRGTIEVLLAQPLSRITIFISKFLAGIVSITAFSFIATLSVIPLAKVYDIEVQIESHWNIFIYSILLGFAIFAMASFFSSFLSSGGLVSACTVGIIVLMYAGDILARLNEEYEIVKYFSFFNYFDAGGAMLDRVIEMNNIAVFTVTGLFLLLSSLALFNKRDVAV